MKTVTVHHISGGLIFIIRVGDVQITRFVWHNDPGHRAIVKWLARRDFRLFDTDNGGATLHYRAPVMK